jgi:hypothetical protein
MAMKTNRRKLVVRDLQITTPINWANVATVFVILAVGSYKFVESPSVFYGTSALILMVILLFLVFARDEVHLDSTGEGEIQSKLWTLTGVKKYKHQSLTKARSIIAIDIGAADAGESIKSYLLFDDGYKLPIPGEDVVRAEIVAWFQSNLNLTLNIIKDLKSL